MQTRIPIGAACLVCMCSSPFRQSWVEDRLHRAEGIDDRAAEVVRAKILVSQRGFEFFLDKTFNPIGAGEEGKNDCLFESVRTIPGEVVKGGYTNIVIGWGLAVTFGIYIAGAITGAHLNPAVTDYHILVPVVIPTKANCVGSESLLRVGALQARARAGRRSPFRNSL